MVRRVGGEISDYYSGGDQPLLIVGILNGAFVFLADLIRTLTIPVEIEFIRTSSYGTGHESSGQVGLVSEPVASPKNRRVLIVDDLIDTGRTLAFVGDYFRKRGVADMEFAVLLDKKTRRAVDVDCRFIGGNVEDRFLGGYGLDGGRYFSQRPYIFADD